MSTGNISDKYLSAAEVISAEPGRGRAATRPAAIPKAGWLDIAWRIKDKVVEEQVGLIAAGVAFYGLFAIFPAITALMSFAGLLYDPSGIVSALEGLSGLVPQDVSQILLDQARGVTGSQEEGLTLGLMLGLSLAIWSASAGVGSLIQGLNVAYGEEETRSFLRLRMKILGFTVALILAVLVIAALLIAVPVVLSFAAISDSMAQLIRLLSYLPVMLVFLGGIVAFYRWGPDRAPARIRWLMPGTVLAATLWLTASVGFGLYVQNFGSYNETFGSIAGVIVLLMWMWLSAFVVLLGAQVNAEIEAQTARDSTTGVQEPLGFRGAQKADEIGPAR